MGKTMTIPVYENYQEAIIDGMLVVVEDRDSHHTRLRARQPFYFAPLKSCYSEGEVVPFSKLETGSGRQYREAQERLEFIKILAELTKCRTCGIYDCTQHNTPTAKELIEGARGTK